MTIFKNWKKFNRIENFAIFDFQKLKIEKKMIWPLGTRTMRAWEVSFDFQFKIEMKIEKNINFDFCLDIEF